MKLSVIIPIYNAERFLDKILDAVADQSVDASFEVILIDDGSTDSTAAICDRRAAADSRFRVIHTDNRGPSAARNRGLDAALGDYVVFVDCDDAVHPLYLARLLQAVEESGAEMAVCRFTREKGGLKATDTPPKVVSGPRLLEMMLYQRGADSSPYCKIYRRRLFNDTRFREGIIFEDLEMHSRLYLKVKTAALIPDRLYLYSPSAYSLLTVYSPARFDAMLVTADIVERLKDVSPTLAKAAADRRLSAAFNAFLLASRHNATDRAARAWAEIKALRRQSLFNPKVRLKNKIGIALSYLGKRPIRLLDRLLH